MKNYICQSGVEDGLVRQINLQSINKDLKDVGYLT